VPLCQQWMICPGQIVKLDSLHLSKWLKYTNTMEFFNQENVHGDRIFEAALEEETSLLGDPVGPKTVKVQRF